MNYYCNPININYRYQFIREPNGDGTVQINREAADPSMILFRGRYYIFASMTLGVWVSDDLVQWENHRLPEELPLYDYAPDVRVIGDYVYFCASNREHACDYYRTGDVLKGPYEKIEGTFDFWDPNLFADEDGRVYFYWGCSDQTPIYGVELDPVTLRPLGEVRELIFGDTLHHGFERRGEDYGITASGESPGVGDMPCPPPFAEGAWMTKHDGTYYLQYAIPGTEYNIYGDGVYVSDRPLGPFVPAKNNPYSLHPGGFFPGAGHGSTMEDRAGNWWHAATMRISVNHDFERRTGIWPAGFDADGELFCNQRYGDWPMRLTGAKEDPWREPEWFLLSYGKTATASSWTKGHEPGLATDENVQTWWRAAGSQSGEWLTVDLGEILDVRAVQINFADEGAQIPIPREMQGNTRVRFIDPCTLYTRWKLEYSADGESYTVWEDKTRAETDLSHDLVVREDGIFARYLRLTVREVPYGQNPCVSGLRVFGRGKGERPPIPSFTALRRNALDMRVRITPQEHTVGYNILWGVAPDKLYHSYMIFGSEKTVGALVQGQEYFVRVDAFNENGITEGKVIELKKEEGYAGE